MTILDTLRSNRLVGVGAAAFLLIGAITVVAAQRSEAQRQLRRYATWFIDGPLCPTWTTPSVTSPAPKKAFEVDGVRIARQHGHQTCWRIRDHEGRGPGEILVCHMLSPGRLEVQSRLGTYRFDPGSGGLATVLVSDSAVRCVMRINERLFADSTVRAYD